jgi:hypothetical protein
MFAGEAENNNKKDKLLTHIHTHVCRGRSKNQQKDKLLTHTYTHVGRGGVAINRTLNKTDVDLMFTFSSPLASNYTGVWFNASLFIITVTHITRIPVNRTLTSNTTSYVPSPVIGQFSVSILATANLRNFPPTSAPSVTSSVPLSGGFGPSVIYIVSVVANDPDDADMVYGIGDTITVTFNAETNRARMPLGLLPRREV